MLDPARLFYLDYSTLCFLNCAIIGYDTNWIELDNVQTKNKKKQKKNKKPTKKEK